MKVSDVAAEYSRQVRTAFRMWAVWPPTSEVQVGDFGRLEKGLFVRQGRLDQSTPIAGPASRHRGDQLFASAGVRHAVLGAAPVSEIGPVGARIEFGRKFGVFLALRDCGETRIADPLAVAAELTDLRQQQRWLEDYCLVSSVVGARAALIAVGADAGGALELSVATPATDIFACLDGELRIASETSVGYRALISSACTPLFALSRLGTRDELQLRGESRSDSSRLLGLDATVA